MYDLLIRQAHIFDGLNQPPIIGDIAIKEGVIARIAPHIAESAHQTRDASGLWLTPGFVDIHTHYDIEVEIAPGLSESVRHGVTSIVMGNCSLSTTIGDPQTLADIFLRVETLPSQLVHQWLKDAIPWQTPVDYFHHLANLPLGPNVAALLGHSALRAKVMGLERSVKAYATNNELKQMRDLAEEALAAGCIGISVDMVHWHKISGQFSGTALPSHHANYKEYKMLAEVCRAHDAVFQVTPNPENIYSFINILRLSLGFFRPPLRNTILSALDMQKHPGLWKIFPLISFICNRLLNANIRFQTLTEPFTIYADGPLTPLFEEFSTGVELNSCHYSEERKQLWSNEKFQRLFKKQWLSKLPKTFHRDFSLMKIDRAPLPSLVGKSFTQVAEEQNLDPLSYFMYLMKEYDDQIRWHSCGANHRPVVRQRLMSHPFILPGFSDAGAHSRHLAFFDSALSLLRQAVTTQFISPQFAIKRITSEPAQWFNLNTGIIKKGVKADLVLIYPDKLNLPIPTPLEMNDPLLDGAKRMVKRDPDPAIAAVYIAGVEVVRDGNPLAILGQKRLGTILTTSRPKHSIAEVLARYRNRINDELEEHPLTEYWDIFLLKHQNQVNASLHCCAVVIMHAVFLLACFTLEIRWLILLPLSQLVGLIGHICFERSNIDVRDTIFSWRAFLSLHRLFYVVIIRQYQNELKRVRHILLNHKKDENYDSNYS